MPLSREEREEMEEGMDSLKNSILPLLPSSIGIQEFIMELTSDSTGLIKDYDILRITDVQKYNFFPRVE